MFSTVKFKASNTITTECDKFRKHQVLLQWHITNVIIQAFWAAPKVMALYFLFIVGIAVNKWIKHDAGVSHMKWEQY